MPYISKERRTIRPKVKGYATTPGDLNYQISCLLLDYMKFNGKSYQQMNDMMGALEGAKLELYRRYIAPYEDKKIEENGDINEPVLTDS